MRRVVLALLASACGRLGFDAQRLAGDASPGGDGPRDSAIDSIDSAIDSMPDAAPLPLMFVQKSSVAASAGGPVTPMLAAASTAGTTLVIAIASNDPTSLVLPPGWQLAVQMYTSGNCSSTIMYYPNNPGGITSVLVTINGAVPTDAVLQEFQGVRLATPVDVIGTANSNNPQASQTVATSASTTAAGDLAIAMFCEDVNNPTYTGGGGGWTNLGTLTNSSASPSFNVDYQLSVPMAVVSETVTSSLGGKYQAAVATFLKQ